MSYDLIVEKIDKMNSRFSYMQTIQGTNGRLTLEDGKELLNICKDIIVFISSRA